MRFFVCLRQPALFLCCAVLLSHAQSAQRMDSQPIPVPTAICSRCIRAHMDFLASDALRGRGSGTQDELITATYIASEFVRYGLEPAGDNGTFIQRATLQQPKLSSPPRLTFKSSSAAPAITTWTHGRQILVLRLGQTDLAGPLQKYFPGSSTPVKPGSFVFLTRTGGQNVEIFADQLISQGAAAVIVPESPRLRAQWSSLAAKLPSLPVQGGEGQQDSTRPPLNFVAVNDAAAAELKRMRDGTVLHLRARVGKTAGTYTWNVIGKISGADRAQEHHVILLTAHMDHLGVGNPVNGDDIYNGADDDASGTTAVMELARVLAALPKPRRTVVFTLFGSEEKGGLGSIYFRSHPPVPLKDIAAYLEFEMIGRADPAVPRDTLWLTGWDRSNLGPELARHGARLVADPHAAEDFFRRSDNYVFAKQGVVAQTVSSYGLHGDYHQPGDDLAHIDFQHMDEAIESMLSPVFWLANSDFVPHWNEGEKP